MLLLLGTVFIRFVIMTPISLSLSAATMVGPMRVFAAQVASRAGTALITGPRDLQEVTVSSLDSTIDLGTAYNATISPKQLSKVKKKRECSLWACVHVGTSRNDI